MKKLKWSISSTSLQIEVVRLSLSKQLLLGNIFCKIKIVNIQRMKVKSIRRKSVKVVFLISLTSNSKRGEELSSRINFITSYLSFLLAFLSSHHLHDYPRVTKLPTPREERS